MEFNREKYERLEARSLELFAVSQHLTEQVTEARQAVFALRGTLASTFKTSLPHQYFSERFSGGRPTIESLLETFEADPDTFRQSIEKAGAEPHLLRLLDDYQKAARELARVTRRQAEHQARMEAFTPAYARCAAYVRQIEATSPHGVNIKAEGQPVNRAALAAGAGWRN